MRLSPSALLLPFALLLCLSLSLSLSLVSAAPLPAPSPAPAPAPQPNNPKGAAVDPVAAALQSKLAAISKQLAKWPVAPTTSDVTTTTASTTATTTTVAARFNPKVLLNPKFRTPALSPTSPSSPATSSSAIETTIPSPLIRRRLTPSASPTPPSFPPLPPALEERALNPKARPSPSSSPLFAPTPSPIKLLPPPSSSSSSSKAPLENPKHVYAYPGGVGTGKWVVGGQTFEGVSPTHPGEPKGSPARQRSSSRPTAPQPSHSHSRSTSASASGSSSRPPSRGAGAGAEGAYVPPTHASDADYDLCNAFWVTPQRSRANHGREAGDAEVDWGREGYEVVLGRVRDAGRVLEDLRGVLKERASAADDYAKRLGKLSRHSFGTGETGHMERAILTLRSELDQSSKAHTELASLMRAQEGMVAEFVQKREAVRKNHQTAIEKLWKALCNTRQHVLKAKAKYEDDAIQINALHAQAALLQGRELDKATLKLDKAQQTVVVNERDYRNYVGVLKETTINWNMQWKQFLDLVQDQEEERLEFVKARLWDFANGQSTLAMAEDESAERTRTALEQCEPKTDVRIFVQQFGTGNAIPDPIPFHDVSSKEPAPKQGYKTARFQRSSTRLPGVKHSPSAVQDIARALGQQPPPASVVAAAPPPPQQQQRPPSRSANRASNPNLAAPPPASSGSAAAVPSPDTTPTRPVSSSHLSHPAETSSASPSPSRFAVSPSANLRASTNSSSTARPTSPGGTRPGHISAAAFQNRQSVVSPTVTPLDEPVRREGSAVSASAAPPARYEAPSSPVKQELVAPAAVGAGGAGAGGGEDDDDDPLLKALKVLQSTPVQAPSRPTSVVGTPSSSGNGSNRFSTSSQSQNPTSPSVVAGGSIAYQRSSVDLRNAAASPSQSQSPFFQASLSLASPAPHGAPARSRPSSPAPMAALMQPPPSSGPPRASSPGPYGAAGRPHSRQGSTASQYRPPSQVGVGVGSTLASPPSVGNFAQRPGSPGPLGGGGGGGGYGRPSSPQPYIPESLRPASPVPPRAASPGPPQQQQQQQRPTSAYGQRPSSVVGGYGQQQQYTPPPLQQQQQGYPAGAPPPLQQQQQHAPPPAQSPYTRATSPPSASPYSPYAPPPSQTQPLASHPSQPYLAQAPSQHFSPPAPHQQQQVPQPYGHQHVLGANGYAYPAAGSAPPPPVASPYAAPPPPQTAYSPAHLARTPSTHSGVSGASSYQPAPSAVSIAQPVQQQQQVQRAPSVAEVAAGQAAPPPTGQYTEMGQPILFYVNALYDYPTPGQALSPEEFAFSTGDVIAVTATDADGWWQGNRVGDPGPSKLFPSNFTEVGPHLEAP
ncbi:hypothetical protein JCM8097_004922 [Rhodosporidiobolus ruineniae]